MSHENRRHEWVRFRRDEIADLNAMPSAGPAALGPAKSRRRFLSKAALAVLCLFIAFAAAVYSIGAFGIGAEQMRSAAERAIEEAAGVDVEIALGRANITLDANSLLALEVHDVSLKAASGGSTIDAGSVRFGVRLMPLLSGQVRITSAHLNDARIVAAGLPAGDGDWVAALRNADGLIDPDKVVPAVFASLHHALNAVHSDSLRRIGLQNVEIALPQGAGVRLLRIAEGRIAEGGSGKVRLTGKADVDGRALAVDASVKRGTDGKRIDSLEAEIAIAPPQGDTTTLAGIKLHDVALHLTGEEGQGDSASRLSVSMLLNGAVFAVGSETFPADIVFNATVAEGANKIAVDRLLLKSGRSRFDFEGSIGPKPRTPGLSEEPSYRYDMVSNGSILAPQDSPEPALKFLARIAGTYATESRQLIADTIALRSDAAGEVLGSLALAFEPGKEPGVSLAIGVHDMPVSQVKQLWPWFSARGARRWVLENLFGGQVLNGNVKYRVEPGRAGNGVPLTGEEVSGRFEIDGSRFDTAGRIPPVRDAIGAVEFHGNDVEITLSSGTVFMPSGRTVAASNGKLVVKKANVSPVIGALDIDVAGEAPAIAELASYEPINAMSHVGILPEELSGTVKGNVKADIPLQAGVDTSGLGWLVSLEYQDLALSKPLDGQIVTEADGTITVDPLKATIVARGRLNGIPAEIDLLEPIGREGPARSRKVVLVIDDQTREAFMPGLSTLLSGTVRVAVDRRDDGSRKVSADLTNTRLTIPWAGWSKGAGVPANVSFTMAADGPHTTLSGFDLDGKSFAIRGRVVLEGDDLSSAEFDRVRLNRGDDVAVSVKRSANGYAVTIQGDALDARPLIKQFTSDIDTATKSTSGSVSVTADVKSLTGFHGEQLANLKLDYSASGARVNGLTVNAVASSGAAINVSSGGKGGQRSLTMTSTDAGAILRFLDIYEHMQGGAITISLSGAGDGPMRGRVDARNFLVVNEPKLASLVSTRPPGGDRSLNQAVKADIDTSRVSFDRGYVEIEKGNRLLRLANGVLRGAAIGATFQGTLYDPDDNMDVTGTFMPIYGLNRIFGEIPLVGALLGNGRDRGLIGVTFRLKGKVEKPELSINPLSAIAPGIFRSIFEFR